MSVSILPAELGFRRPFPVEVAETLTITNTTTSPIAFKVKTTAPKQYCVRPNSGRIEPDRSVEVSVLLQAMKQDPPLDYKCRDKFLVQTVPITGDKEFVSVQEIWDKVTKSDIQEKKIRVTFLPSDGSTSNDAVASTPQRSSVHHATDATPDIPPPAYATTPGFDTTENNGFSSAIAVTPDSKIRSKGIDIETPQAASSTPSSSVAGSFTPAAASLPAAGPISTGAVDGKDASVASLKARLAEAEALISSLKKDSTLRQRKVAGASAASSTEKDVAADPQLAQRALRGTEGVPVQVAALLCLVSFLLAYFFF